MAVILLSECVVSQLNVDGWKTVKIVTPATADGADSIDLSSLFSEGCSSIVSNVTDGSLLAVDKFEDKAVTLPGATANQSRTIVSHGH